MEKKKKQINPKKVKGQNKNHNQIKTSRVRNKPLTQRQKNTPEERLSDLENTLDLNIQILKTFYQSSKTVQTLLTNQSTLIAAIDNIKKQYLKKKYLFNQLKEKKSKSLIELQIYAEKKRKIEEVKDMYQNKIEENEEGLNGKEEHIKKVQKRLQEVEVYIHKLTLNMLDKKRKKYYQDFLINDFLDVNNDLSRQKDLLTKKVEQIKIDLQATVDENKKLKDKNDDENSKSNDKEIKNSDIKKQNEEKLKKLEEKYENRIKFETTKKNLLINAIEKMNGQFNLFKINKLIKRSSKSINLNISKEENIISDNKIFFKKIDLKKKIKERNSGKNKIETEESLSKRAKNNDDINNRINSFLDFSMLNNDNNISKEKFGILKGSFCDLSAINVKDISFIEKKEGF
jgi:hypothetical protein